MSIGAAYSPNAAGISNSKVIESELLQISSRLGSMIERNRMHLDKLTHSIDRAVGVTPEPAAVSASQPRAVPNGVLGNMVQQCEDLEQIGGQVGRLLDRLESIV